MVSEAGLDGAEMSYLALNLVATARRIGRDGRVAEQHAMTRAELDAAPSGFVTILDRDGIGVGTESGWYCRTSRPP